MYSSKKILTAALLVFHLALNAQISVKNTGNIGIGTSAPTQKIHIAGRTLIETNDDEALTFNNTDNSWQYLSFKRSGVRQLWMGLDGGTDFTFSKEKPGNMSFYTNQGSFVFNTQASGDFYINGGRLWLTAQLDNNQVGGSITLSHPGKTAIDGSQAQQWSIYNMTGGYGNSLQFWAYAANGCPGMCTPRLVLMDDGRVGIGTNNPQFKLEVAGNVKGYNFTSNATYYPDYVFQPTYRIRPLSEVELYIQQYHHLPEVPTAEEVEKDGLNLSDHAVILLKKIEELTLYAIEQQKQIKALQEQVEQLKSKRNK